MRTIDLTFLDELVNGDAVAVRAVQRLQPAGGPGDKVFPPTYATGDKTLKYCVETRRVNGESVQCVLLDSVASQANRMEEALQDAWDDGALAFPVIAVDFSGAAGLEYVARITSLQAPHRIADAILRDAIEPSSGLLFRDTPEGKAYTAATPKNATATYLLCPTALVFGVWDSTGPNGGLGAKFARALTSEIVACGTATGAKVGSRLDPLEIRKVPIFERADDAADWTCNENEALHDKKGPVAYSRKGAKADDKGKASSLNHSTIPPKIDVFAGGITFDYAVQTVVLSLPALRRLRFTTGLDGAPLPERPRAERAARTALAALGLAGVLHQRARGYDLRSRSLLVPDSALNLEVVRADGSVESVALTVDGANALVAAAASAAKATGLAWTREPVRLTPAPKLVALVKKSHELAAKNEEEAT